MDDLDEPRLGWRPEIWATLKSLAQEMRREPTPAEDYLWQQLKGSSLAGLKFRHQHGIDPFIVDFYCAEYRLVIEVDGPIHDQQTEQDQFRQEMLEADGYRVLRFTNDEVLTNRGAVLTRIVNTAIQLRRLRKPR